MELVRYGKKLGGKKKFANRNSCPSRPASTRLLSSRFDELLLYDTRSDINSPNVIEKVSRHKICYLANIVMPSEETKKVLLRACLRIFSFSLELFSVLQISF
jgi:hypothetical protein